MRCADNSLYTGITTNLQRRESDHNSNTNKGAKYTRMRQPVTVVYSEKATDRSQASKREHVIKQLSKEQKELLVKKM